MFGRDYSCQFEISNKNLAHINVATSGLEGRLKPPNFTGRISERKFEHNGINLK